MSTEPAAAIGAVVGAAAGAAVKRSFAGVMADVGNLAFNSLGLALLVWVLTIRQPEIEESHRLQLEKFATESNARYDKLLNYVLESERDRKAEHKETIKRIESVKSDMESR